MEINFDKNVGRVLISNNENLSDREIDSKMQSVSEQLFHQHSIASGVDISQLENDFASRELVLFVQQRKYPGGMTVKFELLSKNKAISAGSSFDALTALVKQRVSEMRSSTDQKTLKVASHTFQSLEIPSQRKVFIPTITPTIAGESSGEANDFTAEAALALADNVIHAEAQALFDNSDTSSESGGEDDQSLIKSRGASAKSEGASRKKRKLPVAKAAKVTTSSVSEKQINWPTQTKEDALDILQFMKETFAKGDYGSVLKASIVTNKENGISKLVLENVPCKDRNNLSFIEKMKSALSSLNSSITHSSRKTTNTIMASLLDLFEPFRQDDQSQTMQLIRPALDRIHSKIEDVTYEQVEYLYDTFKEYPAESFSYVGKEAALARDRVILLEGLVQVREPLELQIDFDLVDNTKRSKELNSSLMALNQTIAHLDKLAEVHHTDSDEKSGFFTGWQDRGIKLAIPSRARKSVILDVKSVPTESALLNLKKVMSSKFKRVSRVSVTNMPDFLQEKLELKSSVMTFAEGSAALDNFRDVCQSKGMNDIFDIQEVIVNNKVFVRLSAVKKDAITYSDLKNILAFYQAIALENINMDFRAGMLEFRQARHDLEKQQKEEHKQQRRDRKLARAAEKRSTKNVLPISIEQIDIGDELTEPVGQAPSRPARDPQNQKKYMAMRPIFQQSLVELDSYKVNFYDIRQKTLSGAEMQNKVTQWERSLDSCEKTVNKVLQELLDHVQSATKDSPVAARKIIFQYIVDFFENRVTPDQYRNLSADSIKQLYKAVLFALREIPGLDANGRRTWFPMDDGDLDATAVLSRCYGEMQYFLNNPDALRVILKKQSTQEYLQAHKEDGKIVERDFTDVEKPQPPTEPKKLEDEPVIYAEIGGFTDVKQPQPGKESAVINRLRDSSTEQLHFPSKSSEPPKPLEPEVTYSTIGSEAAKPKTRPRPAAKQNVKPLNLQPLKPEVTYSTIGSEAAKPKTRPAAKQNVQPLKLQPSESGRPRPKPKPTLQFETATSGSVYTAIKPESFSSDEVTEQAIIKARLQSSLVDSLLDPNQTEEELFFILKDIEVRGLSGVVYQAASDLKKNHPDFSFELIAQKMLQLLDNESMCDDDMVATMFTIFCARLVSSNSLKSSTSIETLVKLFEKVSSIVKAKQPFYIDSRQKQTTQEANLIAIKRLYGRVLTEIDAFKRFSLIFELIIIK